MNIFLSNLLGVIQPLNPLKWSLLVRGIRRSEGWAPPMMLIASLMVLAGLNAGLGLLGNVALVRCFNILALTTWVVVASAATIIVWNDSIKNLRRYGFAVSRPRWWFELSRAAWITGLFLGLSILLVDFLPFQAPIFAGPIFALTCSSIFIFLTGTTVGLILTALHGRSPSGRAYQCVEYFYMLFVAGAVATALVIIIPRILPIGNSTLLLIVTILVAVLLAIVCVGVGKRWKTKPDANAT